MTADLTPDPALSSPAKKSRRGKKKNVEPEATTAPTTPETPNDAAADTAPAASSEPTLTHRVLVALLNGATTVEAVQAEVNLGATEHVAVQLIEAALDRLETTNLATWTNAKGEPAAYHLADDALARLGQRRALILADLARTGGAKSIDAIATAVGMTARDVAYQAVELVQRGLCKADRDLTGHVLPAEFENVLLLATRSAVDAMIGLGALRVAADTLPLVPAPPPAPAPAAPEDSDFAIGLQKLLKATAKELADERARTAKIAAWFEQRGIHEPDLLVAPPVVPSRATFAFERTVKVDIKEKGRMYEEDLRLRGELAVAEAKLEGAKGAFKLEAKILTDQIEELARAAQSGTRTYTVLAYREADWDAGVDVVRAASDGRELAREPMPKGRQRAIPGTDAAPVDAPAADAAATPPGETTPPVDAASAIEAGATAPTEPAPALPVEGDPPLAAEANAPGNQEHADLTSLPVEPAAADQAASPDQQPAAPPAPAYRGALTIPALMTVLEEVLVAHAEGVAHEEMIPVVEKHLGHPLANESVRKMLLAALELLVRKHKVEIRDQGGDVMYVAAAESENKKSKRHAKEA